MNFFESGLAQEIDRFGATHARAAVGHNLAAGIQFVNTLVASSKASPSSKPLEIFDAVIALLFLSRRRREPVLGGLELASVTKLLPFAAESLQCCFGGYAKRAGPQDLMLSARGLFSPGPPNRV